MAIVAGVSLILYSIALPVIFLSLIHILYSVVGKGSFVADANMELMKEEHLRRIEENLQNAVEAARISHIELQELQDILKMLYEDEG